MKKKKTFKIWFYLYFGKTTQRMQSRSKHIRKFSFLSAFIWRFFLLEHWSGWRTRNCLSRWPQWNLYLFNKWSEIQIYGDASAMGYTYQNHNYLSPMVSKSGKKWLNTSGNRFKNKFCRLLIKSSLSWTVCCLTSLRVASVPNKSTWCW